MPLLFVFANGSREYFTLLESLNRPNDFFVKANALGRSFWLPIAMFLVTSPIVINVPTRGLLVVETMHAIVQRLVNLNIKRNMASMFVNKKQRY